MVKLYYWEWIPLRIHWQLIYEWIIEITCESFRKQGTVDTRPRYLPSLLSSSLQETCLHVFPALVYPLIFFLPTRPLHVDGFILAERVEEVLGVSHWLPPKALRPRVSAVVLLSDCQLFRPIHTTLVLSHNIILSLSQCGCSGKKITRSLSRAI